MKKKTHLQQAYSSYIKKKHTKSSLLSGFKIAMPKIILRTTKLEGEPVTKNMVNFLFR